jgi:tetratricopeptide (TPR) repeat protein
MCELCNLVAMIFLQKDKFDLTLVFLQKADALACGHPKYLAITLNNKACYYRKTGKLRTALQCLQDALHLEWKSKKEDTLADTYLNLCAVLSQLGRHKEALENVLFSVSLLQEELFTSEKAPTERLLVLTIAYHNLAV